MTNPDRTRFSAGDEHATDQALEQDEVDRLVQGNLLDTPPGEPNATGRPNLAADPGEAGDATTAHSP